MHLVTFHYISLLIQLSARKWISKFAKPFLWPLPREEGLVSSLSHVAALRLQLWSSWGCRVYITITLTFQSISLHFWRSTTMEERIGKTARIQVLDEIKQKPTWQRHYAEAKRSPVLFINHSLFSIRRVHLLPSPFQAHPAHFDETATAWRTTRHKSGRETPTAAHFSQEVTAKFNRIASKQL